MDEFFARNRLSAYVDGELPDSEMAEVANAIEGNDALRKEYLEMLRSVEFLRRHGPVPAPPRLHLKVMQAVDGLPMPRRRWGWFAGPFARFSWEGTAVVAVAVTVLVLAWVAPQTRLSGVDQPEVASLDQKTTALNPPENAPQPEGDGATDGVAMVEEQAPLRVEAKTTQEGSVVRLPVVRGSRGGARQSEGALEGVYVPAWDQEPNETPTPAISGTASVVPGGSEGTGPVAYILYPNYPNALKGVSDVAYRLGGTALTASGDALVPFDLTVEKNHARVIIQVPLDQIGSVESQLKTLGGVVPVQVQTKPVPGVGAVPIYVEVMYEP